MYGVGSPFARAMRARSESYATGSGGSLPAGRGGGAAPWTGASSVMAESCRHAPDRARDEARPGPEDRIHRLERLAVIRDPVVTAPSDAEPTIAAYLAMT